MTCFKQKTNKQTKNNDKKENSESDILGVPSLGFKRIYTFYFHKEGTHLPHKEV